MKIENAKHERFCQEYIIDLNGYKAAVRAEYSEKTARVQASQLLSKLNLQARIVELMEKRSERTHISQDRVLNELALIGFSDLKNYVEAIGDTGAIRAKDFEEMPEGESRVLKKIKEDRVIKENADGSSVTVYDKVSFELHDKLKALELLGKHLGMFIDNKVSGSIDVNIVKKLTDIRPEER